MSELCLPQPDDSRNYHQVYLKLPHEEYAQLRAAFESAGEPEPSRSLGHNAPFASFIRGVVLGRVELGTDVSLPAPDSEESRFCKVPLSLTEETLHRLSDEYSVSELSDRYRNNGSDARRVRACLQEWLTEVTE